MGLAGGFAWMNTYSKRQCRSLFWRVRAAVKKAFKKGVGGKQQPNFKYDPSSYALNFDDGGKEANNNHNTLSNGFHHLKLHHFLSSSNITSSTTTPSTTWVFYVLWVKASENPESFMLSVKELL
ncbi:hypothetical protein Dimus_035194 [Dionaea muscipula]